MHILLELWTHGENKETCFISFGITIIKSNISLHVATVMIVYFYLIVYCCRDILLEYSEEVMKLGVCLFGLMSEALGLDPNHLTNMGCADGLAVLGHYYPSCPQPELTIGNPSHTDNTFITILLQDRIGGLKIFYQNHWTDVPPISGALVVNVGDLLQASLYLSQFSIHL